jgi:hypothetical protein
MTGGGNDLNGIVRHSSFLLFHVATDCLTATIASPQPLI